MKDLLIDEARRLLAAVPGERSTWPPMRWTIRTDLFDALRSELEHNALIVTDVRTMPPTFLGLPYDLGWPKEGALLTLEISPGR